MDLDTRPFDYEFAPGTIHYGRGCVSRLGRDLADLGLERAMVVTGTNVGANDAVMEPVRAGLGERLAAVFAETTPEFGWRPLTTPWTGSRRPTSTSSWASARAAASTSRR